MAINPLNTTTRILGLSSGMDTESIVKNLMQIEQLKMNKDLRAKATLQWRQDALKSVATDMKSFRSTFLTTLGASGMLSSGTYTSYNVTLTGAKKDAVTISATAEAALKKVTINKITKLAEAASIKSPTGVSGAGKTELSEGNHVKLGELDFAKDLFVGTKTIKEAQKVQVEGDYGLAFALQDGSNKTVYRTGTAGSYTYFDADGADITSSLTQAQIDEMKPVMTVATQPKLNEHGEAMFHDQHGKVYFQDTGDPSIYYQYDAGGTKTTADITGLTLTPVSEIVYEDKVVADDTIKFAINGQEFTFTKDTTLAQMFSAVNNSTAGVSMSYSRLTDSFVISSKETGADASLSIENIRGNAFGTGGTFTNADGTSVTISGSAFNIAEYGAPERDSNGEILTDSNGDPILRTDIAGALKGSNAIVYIEGTRVERSTNSFTIDGIRYTLNYTTDEADDLNFDPANAITANLSQNVDASVDKIKQFVEGYNTMVNKLYGLVNEKKNSAYYALTDEEKSAMTENQIKDWEALAKSGLLRNDRDIQNVLSRLRESFYTAVEGTGLSAQDIGLRTSYGSRSGEITINETDLRAALEKDSDTVMRVFMQSSETDNYNESGLLYRLDNILGTYVNKTQAYTLSSMDNNLTKLSDKIYDMEKRLATLEEKYYAKYAAMETALAKLQSQTNWISSMLGTTNSNSK